MDVFEYDEVRWPTRALQQEEEEQAVSSAAVHLQPPQINWQQGVQQITKPHLLVTATSPASCALLQAATTQYKLLATITKQQAPSTSTEDSAASSSSTTTTAQLYAADDSSSSSLVCCCSTAVADESAPAWARGVLQQLQPQQLLIVGTMQADQYRGDADPSQDFTAYLLQTTAAAGDANNSSSSSSIHPVVPFLPSGSLVSGLPAALITQAEHAGIAAKLLVVVETVPALVPETLHDLSKVMVKLIKPSAGALVDSLQQEKVIEQARSQLQQTTCRPSSVYS